MKKTKRITFFSLLVILILAAALTACGSKKEEPQDEGAAVTAVVQTAMAAITQTAAVQSPTPTATATALPTNTPIPTLAASPTIPALPTATNSFNQPTNPSSSCDVGTFVKDVTIPDGTAIAAGAAFTKTWEIKNSGTCTWNKNYTITFYGGEQMAEKASYNFTTEDVEPGESIKISVDMTAPTKTGSYTSYWIFRNDAGQNFFVDGGSIYAQISVGGTATPGPSATPNEAPTIQIDAPANNAIFPSGDPVPLEGTADDTEDKDISYKIVWTSDKVTNPLGTGASINALNLQDGPHTITASITDSGGTTKTDQITITVGP